MMNTTRMEKIAAFAKARIYETAAARPEASHDSEYRWNHTLRVAQYGRQVAETEGADVELCLAACLLHDIAKFDGDGNADGIDHGRAAARIIRPFLREIGYSAKQVENICYSVAVHVDGKADFEHPTTIEADIVSDADNIDRFGAYRLLQRYERDIHDWEKLTGEIEKRLATLRKYREEQILETRAGNKLFNRQLDFQIEFHERILAERNLSQPVEM
ncbi:MAG: HD domain-containing protein [Chloroflexi bacterium]|nr:HD domain-containing protein [Chloroflexota bacterium]